MKTKTSRPFAKPPKTFDGLCRLFPPRPIRDAADHDNTMELVDVLAVQGENLNKDQADYLDLLSTLVSTYDAEHYVMDLSHITPLDRLKSLCEERGMNTSALGDLLGNRSLGSKILRGERELSKAHIRILADHFKVSPAFFF